MHVSHRKIAQWDQRFGKLITTHEPFSVIAKLRKINNNSESETGTSFKKTLEIPK